MTGSTGFIGSALTRKLKVSGHEVIPLTRQPVDSEHVLWDPNKGINDLESFESHNFDVVIHLAGVSIAEKKWSDEQKRAIRDSRELGTKTLVDSLSKLKNKPKQLISSSAIGYYGIDKDKEHVETDAPGDDFLAKVCISWEEQALIAKNHGIKTAIIRTGIVLDKSGGTLKQLLLPFKLGAGGRLGNGKQYMSWISLEDELRAIEFILDKELEGTFNLCAPNPVTNQEFTKALGKRLSRPTLLPTPLAPLKVIYGTELVETLLLGSIKVLPKALLESGFSFEHIKLEDALKEVV